MKFVAHIGHYNFTKISSKSDEKQKPFINSPFLCSEIQSVSRIVKIIHSGGPPSSLYVTHRDAAEVAIIVCGSHGGHDGVCAGITDITINEEAGCDIGKTTE